MRMPLTEYMKESSLELFIVGSPYKEVVHACLNAYIKQSTTAIMTQLCMHIASINQIQEVISKQLNMLSVCICLEDIDTPCELS